VSEGPGDGVLGSWDEDSALQQPPKVDKLRHVLHCEVVDDLFILLETSKILGAMD
jgi:hypothetical protein